MYIYMDLEWSESFLVVVFVDPPKNIHEIGFCGGKPPKNQTRTRKHKQKLKFTATIPSRFDTKHL